MTVIGPPIQTKQTHKRTSCNSLARDPISSASRGFGYVELGSVEAAEHVLRQSLGLREVQEGWMSMELFLTGVCTKRALARFPAPLENPG